MVIFHNDCHFLYVATVAFLTSVVIAEQDTSDMEADVDLEDEGDVLEDPANHHVTFPSINGDSHREPLPIFLEEPTDTYIIKNKPAVMQCKAMYALKLTFKCPNIDADSIKEFDYVDPEIGIRHFEMNVTISKKMVEEYYGAFKCECMAQSSQGHIKSKPAVVREACQLELKQIFSQK